MEKKEVVVFGGGCFWCIEAVFKIIKGVISVRSGYAGGTDDRPTYEKVSAGGTGHIEVVRVEFDPEKISFRELLSVFFASHDPTSIDRQGEDIGEQYRSTIFYTTPEQKKTAETTIGEINSSSPEGKPVVTEIRPLEKFHEAEEYHDDYYEKHSEAPYCRLVIDPKLKKIKEEFRDILNK